MGRHGQHFPSQPDCKQWLNYSFMQAILDSIYTTAPVSASNISIVDILIIIFTVHLLCKYSILCMFIPAWFSFYHCVWTSCCDHFVSLWEVICLSSTVCTCVALTAHLGRLLWSGEVTVSERLSRSILSPHSCKGYQF